MCVYIYVYLQCNILNKYNDKLTYKNISSVLQMDLSQVLSKPIIVIQTSENVTKLIGALLR